MKENYPSYLEKRYDISVDNTEEAIIEDIARRRGCIIKGGELDLDKASSLLLDEFRNGILGRISLELPEGQD
ncbi:MAG: hypothetical protein GX995_08295 [Clostridiales bacterium]|nr:hypothetical protein [Clostridiales bacterium]